MLKNFRFILFCALASTATLSTSAYSMVTNILQPGMTLEYDLAPNEPQVFINYMYWPIAAVCTIETQDESDELFVEAKLKKGKINEIELSEGESVTITVHAGEDMKLKAESGAKVKITNFGKHHVKATCTA